MQRLEVSGAVRPLQGSLGVKGLNFSTKFYYFFKIRKRKSFNELRIFGDNPKFMVVLYKPCFDQSLAEKLGVWLCLLPTEGRPVAPPTNIALYRWLSTGVRRTDLMQQQNTLKSKL